MCFRYDDGGMLKENIPYNISLEIQLYATVNYNKIFIIYISAHKWLLRVSINTRKKCINKNAQQKYFKYKNIKFQLI